MTLKPSTLPPPPHPESDIVETSSLSAPPPPKDARVLSADQIADDLGLHRAEVVDLMRRGELPAKRIGSNLFTTSDKLAAFVARADHRSALPRYRTGDIVVVLDENGSISLGRFAGDLPDGRVQVIRTGFLSDFERSYAPEQLQPFTARIPPEKTH